MPKHEILDIYLTMDQDSNQMARATFSDAYVLLKKGLGHGQGGAKGVDGTR